MHNHVVKVYHKNQDPLIPLAILVLTIAVIGNIIAVDIMKTSEITGIVTAIAVSLPVLWYIGRWIYGSHSSPWKITFTDKPRDAITGDSEMSEKLCVSLGVKKITMKLVVRTPSTSSYFTVRPQVEQFRLWHWLRHWEFYHRNFKSDEDRPITIVNATNLNADKATKYGENRQKDNVGGVSITYTKDEYSLNGGTREYFVLEIDAEAKWKGAIEFSGNVGEHRRYVYQKFEVR